jgi:5'-phosphate synthase pdxT subunit
MQKIGILALQGDFEAHGRTLTRLGADPIFVRTAADLDTVDALVIPGGESTTMLKLLLAENLLAPLAAFGRRRPIFGTCAGAILLAAGVSNPEQEGLGLLDIDVERNAYGRQIDSRVARFTPEAEFAARTHPGEMEAVFIRAPVIRRVGPQARVLARYQGDPVLVEQGKHLAATFHPELTADSRVHELFLSKL